MKTRGIGKNIFLILLIVLLTSSISFAGTFTGRVNNQKLNLDNKIFYENGDLMVPAKEVLEKVGVEVINDKSNIKLILDDRIVEMIFGKNEININGEVKKINSAARYDNEAAYIPLKIVSEELNLGLYLNQDGSFHLYTKGITNAKVDRIESLNSLILDIDGKKEKVRLIGIDPIGDIGLAYIDADYNVKKNNVGTGYLNKLLLNKDVTIELDAKERDENGDLLVYVWIDDVMVNKALLERGYARVETYLPNAKYMDDFFMVAENKVEKNKEKNLKDKGIQTDGSTLVENKGKVIKSFESTISKNGN